MKKCLLVIAFTVLVPKAVFAHCPLCTVGAGALAVLAAYLGVSSVVVGVLIGAFSLALGLWISGKIKKQYIRYQKHILSAIIFLGTVIPIMPLIQHYGPFYVSFIGEYGTTYRINLYVFGVIIGSLIMLAGPFMSRLVTKVRNKQAPFQGVSITIALLIATSVLIQLLS
jgi:hypothetical protein